VYRDSENSLKGIKVEWVEHPWTWLHNSHAVAERDRVQIQLPPGSYRLREIANKNKCLFTVAEGGARELHWDIAWNLDTPSQVSSETIFFRGEYFSRPGQLFCIHEFQQIFSRDCLASEVQLDLGNQSILFTDIVGSTKLYQEVGDAAEIQRAFGPGKKVRLRVSLHHGPVIAVNWNTGKDYFGHVVNFSAKLQSCAGAGEVAMSEEFVVKTMDDVSYPSRTVELAISGMKEKAKVRVVDFASSLNKTAA